MSVPWHSLIARREGRKWGGGEVKKWTKRSLSRRKNSSCGEGWAWIQMSWERGQELRLIMLGSFHFLNRNDIILRVKGSWLKRRIGDWRSWWRTNEYQPFQWHVHLGTQRVPARGGRLWSSEHWLGAEIVAGGHMRVRAIRELNLLVKLT